MVGKPESHTTLYERLAGVEAAGDLQQFTIRRWNGRFHTVHTYRYANTVPLREGEDAVWVNWCELTITKETAGTILYRNAFATQHHLDHTSVESVVQAGRARWKIENENNNTLKTKGYHLEHNYGHGKQHLSAVLLTATTFATPVLAATTSRHVVNDANGRVMSTMHRDEGGSCIRAPSVGAFATEPWTVPPCEPNTGY